jgi:hypothetical protein
MVVTWFTSRSEQEISYPPEDPEFEIDNLYLHFTTSKLQPPQVWKRELENHEQRWIRIFPGHPNNNRILNISMGGRPAWILTRYLQLVYDMSGLCNWRR